MYYIYPENSNPFSSLFFDTYQNYRHKNSIFIVEKAFFLNRLIPDYIFTAVNNNTAVAILRILSRFISYSIS